MPAESRPAVLLAGVLLALAGCAAEPAPPAVLPLDGLRAVVGTATEDRRRETTVAFEEALAQCLHEQGFEYVPEPGPVEAQLPAEDARDYAARWGYGISTAPAGPEVVAPPAMSPEEEAAYTAALYGTWGAEGTGADEGTGGCWEVANSARAGAPAAQAASAVAGLAPELEVLELRIALDQRVADAHRSWSHCMAEAGFDVPTPQDAPQAAILAGQALQAAAPDPASPQVLADIQDVERRIAVEDVTCREVLDLAGTERRVRAEHEAEFVERLGAEVEALVAALTEAADGAAPD